MKVIDIKIYILVIFNMFYVTMQQLIIHFGQWQVKLFFYKVYYDKHLSIFFVHQRMSLTARCRILDTHWRAKQKTPHYSLQKVSLRKRSYNFLRYLDRWISIRYRSPNRIGNVLKLQNLHVLAEIARQLIFHPPPKVSASLASVL